MTNNAELTSEYLKQQKECLRKYLSKSLENEWLSYVTLADFDFFFNIVYINYLKLNENPSFTEREELYKSFVLGVRRGRSFPIDG